MTLPSDVHTSVSAGSSLASRNEFMIHRNFQVWTTHWIHFQISSKTGANYSGKIICDLNDENSMLLLLQFSHSKGALWFRRTMKAVKVTVPQDDILSSQAIPRGLGWGAGSRTCIVVFSFQAATQLKRTIVDYLQFFFFF